MRILKTGLIAALFLMPVTLAQAADFSVPNDAETTSGFYLRGDAGWSFLEWNGGQDDSSFVFGGGAGYQFSDAFRADVTLDRSGNYSIAPGSKINTTTMLGNVYFDLANNSMFTPYVGMGAGYSWVSNHEDGVTLGLAAGVAIDLSNSIAVDAGYRFRDVMTKGPDVQEHQATLGLRVKF